MSAVLVLNALFDSLWLNYRQRVPYAATYQNLVEKNGGTVRNDHIAFRTFNCPMGSQPSGVDALARIFEPLGYQKKERYVFTDKKLTAWHWEHEGNPTSPKLFISQLEVDELTTPVADIIRQAVVKGDDILRTDDRDLLKTLAAGKPIEPAVVAPLSERLAKVFCRPWPAPRRQAVERVNPESQYAAWTLLHGNEVNHFTAYINDQNVSLWPDIEATADALQNAGVPMKVGFEGERGTKLRQTSTQAVDEVCDVVEEDGKPGRLSWSYAYYELAERGFIPGPDGKPMLFSAFLGEQATNLFEMTKRGNS